ncbi:hypothetical protein [Terricaulis silvestris]|uniref:hypothetical protein n=1 Tax=Terricaulis silvestris TaxID=2686094 RepID=UPI00131ADC1D|nr:hypothetical protein [Terricaulis silvestris]
MPSAKQLGRVFGGAVMGYLQLIATVKHLAAHGADNDVLLGAIGMNALAKALHGIFRAGIVGAAQNRGDLPEPFLSRRGALAFHDQSKRAAQGSVPIAERALPMS